MKLEKAFEDERPRTWISVTRAGRKALASEIAARRDIVGPVKSVAKAGRAGMSGTAPAQP